MKNYKTPTKDLLRLLSVLKVAIIAPNALQMIRIFQQKDRRLKEYSANSLRSTLYRLKTRRLIFIAEKNRQTIVKLTQKGKTRFLKYKIDEIKIPIPKVWDSKWRLIIFDIPNKKTSARNVLRDKLKELGFYKIQKSVWLYPYDCKKEIDFIKIVYEVDLYVKLIVAEKIDGEEKYLKFFNLKKT